MLIRPVDHFIKSHNKTCCKQLVLSADDVSTVNRLFSIFLEHLTEFSAT